MPGAPKRSGARLIRGKPTPPNRDTLHQYFGQEAARLLSVYRRVENKQGAGARGKKRAVKAAALDLLYAIVSPPSMISLFNVMLGGVAGASTKSKFPWLDVTLDYDARAHNKGRSVTNAEVVDKAILPTYAADRDNVMRQVRKVREAERYRMMLDARRIYLMDNPDTV